MNGRSDEQILATGAVPRHDPADDAQRLERVPVVLRVPAGKDRDRWWQRHGPGDEPDDGAAPGARDQVVRGNGFPDGGKASVPPWSMVDKAVMKSVNPWAGS